MKLTPLQRRAERKSRNKTMVDMNLVSLIDVFTILIFFLLSNSGGVETLPSPKAVHLPESVAEKAPRETVIVVVSGSEILVGGRRIASVAEVMATEGDLIAPLKAELEQQAARVVIRKENEADAKRLTIMGDKDIPYRLLRKIMFTGARANFADVSFAVRRMKHEPPGPPRRMPQREARRSPHDGGRGGLLPHAGPAVTLASDDEIRFRRIGRVRCSADLHRHAVAAGVQARSGQAGRARRADGAPADRAGGDPAAAAGRQAEARSGQAARARGRDQEAGAGEAGVAQAERARQGGAEQGGARARGTRAGARQAAGRDRRGPAQGRRHRPPGDEGRREELHGAPIAVQMRTDIKQGPGVGTSTGVGVGAGNEAGVPTRNLITSNATGGSGGINTAAYSKNTGGGGLAGRSTTMVEGAIGGGGGGGPGGGGAAAGATAPAAARRHGGAAMACRGQRPRGGGGKASRSRRSPAFERKQAPDPPSQPRCARAVCKARWC
jgi:biopolymer transport protein ExbD